MDRNLIKSVLADNQQEVPQFKVIPRDFRFEKYGNYVFVGVRRAGKSFLLYQRMQELLAQGLDWDEILYVNFEDERLIGMTAEHLNLLLEVHFEMYGHKKPILFLDEIQNIAGWEKFARRLVDNKYQVYITGSNAKMLSHDIQTTLGGRYISVEIYPYDFKEYLNAHEVKINNTFLNSTKGKALIQRYFNEYFYYGGFPESTGFSVKRDYLSSVYQKIFLGDIALRHSVENDFALKILFKKLAESVKQPISFTRIARIVSSTGAKVGTQTIINYIEYAKEAWLISSIQNIAGKLAEKETNPKYYFVDNGILNLFLVDANTSLLENMVAINLLRRYGRENAVFFYNQGVEVDFYIPDAGMAIQVCYNLYESPDTLEREVGALIKLSGFIECQRLLIITRDSEEVIHRDAHVIEVVPIWKWLLQEKSNN